MNSTRRVIEAEAEELASLHVLELLSPDEEREFAHQLESDPALRELVRELQGNIEALALAEPSRSAPPHVWGRISAELPEAPAATFPSWVRPLTFRILAAAACLTFGALGQFWWSRSNSRTGTPEPTLEAGLASPLPTQIKVTNYASVTPPPVLTSTSGGPPEKTPPPTDSIAAMAAKAEAARLRGRVQVLAAQVSALNQVLEQQQQHQPVFPAGVTRLHVFQLVNTNHPGARITGHAAAESSVNPIPDLLAQLAATQLNPNRKDVVSPLPRVGSELVSNESAPVPNAGSIAPGNLPIVPAPITVLAPTIPPTATLTANSPGSSVVAGNLPAPLPTTTIAASTPPDTSVATPSADPAAPHVIDVGSAALGSPGKTEIAATTGNPAAPGASGLLATALGSGPSSASPNWSASTSVASGLALGEGSALGFVAPDLGIGTIALSNDQPLGFNEVFQVWTIGNGPGASTSFQSLGTAYADGPVVVLKFNLATANFTLDSSSMPSLVVTREPTGGSTAPTGPVIVGPRPSP